MKLKLTRPIVTFDLEATGTNPETDRIVQIGLHKRFPSGHCDTLEILINPERPIPPAATAVHGITDEMVANAPTFAQAARAIRESIANCDLAGFNCLAFDVPLLYNEFQRTCFEFIPSNHHIIDVGNLFKIQEQRTLTAAVKFYIDRNHDGAHTAGADARATDAVLVAQLERYEGLPLDAGELATCCNYGCGRADVAGKFKYTTEGVLLLNFGKHKDQPAENHQDFLLWMMRSNFPTDTLFYCEKILYPQKPVRNEEFGFIDDLPF